MTPSWDDAVLADAEAAGAEAAGTKEDASEAAARWAAAAALTVRREAAGEEVEIWVILELPFFLRRDVVPSTCDRSRSRMARGLGREAEIRLLPATEPHKSTRRR